MSSAWMPGEFCIAKGYINADGTEVPTTMQAVDGETWGPFGLYRLDASMRLWGVTHLVTGREMGAFERKKDAQRYCRAVADLTDWATVHDTLAGPLLTAVRDAFERFNGVRLIRLAGGAP